MKMELEAKRRLKEINVFEVSLVDKAANNQKFIVFKRFDENKDESIQEMEGGVRI